MTNTGGQGRPIASLLFAPGQRPDANALEALAVDRPGGSLAGGGFAVTFRSAPELGLAELLSQGLTFDCTGLASAPPAPLIKTAAFYGLDRDAMDPGLEAIALAPGPHLAGSESMLPVIRTLAGLAVRLAALPGVVAVGWEPARSLMAPDYYARIVSAWLAGGAFPALGLMSLERTGNGAVCSQGLAFFTGQELIVEGGAGRSPALLARIAVRLAHELVECGPLKEPSDLTGPDGEALRAVPEDRGRILRLTWR